MTGTEQAPLWGTSSSAPVLPGPSPTAVDVVVAGAGIVGLTCALELARSGASVVVVEAGSGPGLGVTGQSTAKVTVGHGLVLSEVRRKHGEDGAGQYLAAAQLGLDTVRGFAAGEDWCMASTHDMYATDQATAEKLATYVDDVRVAGGAAAMIAPQDLGLAVPARDVVRHEDQLLIQPIRYAELLARHLGGMGVHIVTGAAVVSVEGASPLVVGLADGSSIQARDVVLATHLPFPLRSLVFGLVEQRRHYAVAGRVQRDVPTSYDVGDGWSTRPWHDGMAVAVGGGHPTGKGDPTASLHSLRTWAETTLGLDVTHSWSTQDAFSTDSMPIVGRSPGDRRPVWVASGFGAWGLSLGSAAGIDIAGQIAGGEQRFPAWSLLRATLAKHPATSAAVVGRTAANLAGSVLSGRSAESAEAAAELGPGQGAVVREGGELVAVSVDRDGVQRRVTARCTHMGCVLAWNNEATSWDCPCHGSRFAADGSVLHGPAVSPLEPVQEAPQQQGGAA